MLEGLLDAVLVLLDVVEVGSSQYMKFHILINFFFCLYFVVSNPTFVYFSSWNRMRRALDDGPWCVAL